MLLDLAPDVNQPGRPVSVEPARGQGPRDRVVVNVGQALKRRGAARPELAVQQRIENHQTGARAQKHKGLPNRRCPNAPGRAPIARVVQLPECPDEKTHPPQRKRETGD